MGNAEFDDLQDFHCEKLMFNGDEKDVLWKGSGPGVNKDDTYPQVKESLQILSQCWQTDEFEWDGSIQISPRSVIPRPLQLPHPPLYMACTKDETVRLAAEYGVGTIPSSRLRSWLEDLNVYEFFDYFGFSDEIGVYKPDSKIFNETLTGLGISDPSQSIHVGDLKRTDVAGARANNMTSVRYIGGRDDPEDGDEADYVIKNHLEILKLL